MRDLVRIGLPLMVSYTSVTAMYFCDRVFVAWHSTREMGAVMNGGAVIWTSLALPMGTVLYAATFIAQYIGAGHRERIGVILGSALRICLYCIPYFLAFGLLAPWTFSLFGHELDLRRLETLYVQVLSLGSPAVVFGTALSTPFIGQGRTRIVMIVDVVSAGMNILLDYILIFGHFGFPEGGLEGAAWATVISMWSKPTMLAAFLYVDPQRPQYQLAEGLKWDPRMLIQLLKYGVPSGLQILQEASTFTLFLLLIGRLGPWATEATTMAINVNMVAFVPIVGIGIAVSTMVGQQIGRRRPDLAERATWSGLILSTLYAAPFGIVYLTLPSLLLRVYDLDSRQQLELQAMAVVLLRFVAAYCIFDAVQLVFASAVKGAGDTWFAMVASVSLMVAFLLTGTIGATWFSEPRQQLLWWWMALAGWIWLLALVFFARFRAGQWKSMSVLESNID
jgi:MATE family multidrug resistance protein